jgi:hypothetical protein
MKLLPIVVLVFSSVCRASTITVESPQTISDAADRAEPGDVIVVRPGTYRENVRLRHSGTPDAPIRFVAEKPGTVIITGADPITGFNRVEGNEPIYRIAWPYHFVIDHRDGKPIEAHPENEPVWGRAEQVIADDQLLLPCRDLADLRIAWNDREKRLQPPLKNLGGPFVGMFAVDTTYHVLYVWLSDGTDPANHAMQSCTRSQLFGVNEWESEAGVHDVQVSGFIFRYAANFPQRAAVILHGSNNLLEHCQIEKMSGTGVSVAGIMRHCLIRDNGFCGGAVEGDNFHIEHSVWQDNCWKPIDRNWEAGGAKVCDSRHGDFSECIFYRNGGPGLWFDIDCRDITARDCAFVENELSGAFVEISDSIRIENNYLSGNANGTVGQVRDESWSAGGIQIAESRDCVVQGNTCVDNKDGITLREIGPRSVTTRGEESIYHVSNIDINHNTIAKSHGYELALWWDNNFFGLHPSAKGPSSSPAYNPAEQNLSIDNDTFAPGGKFLIGVPWRPKSKKLSSLADFAKATGFEKSGKISDQSISPSFNLQDKMKDDAPFDNP